MIRFRSLLFCFFAILTATTFRAAETKFVSGKDYQIRCIEWPAGCVAPSPTDDEALVLTMTNDEANWWTITATDDGVFTIRNAQTGRYFTCDGIRTNTRRYMRLSKGDHGTQSRWDIYVSQTALLFRSCFMKNPYHYLNVRRGSLIVGTYGENATIASDNERFFLVNRKGHIVTEFGGSTINIPDNCFGKDDEKARTLSANADKQGTTSGQATHNYGNAVKQLSKLAFTLDGRAPVYDSERQAYLFPIPENDIRNSYTAKVTLQNQVQGKLYVDGKATTGCVRFDNPANGRTYRLQVVDGADTTAVALLSFTALPIIEINGSSLSKSQFTSGTFRLHDPAGRDCDSLLNVRLRYRGDYTSILQKKTFAVKFVDGMGKKQNRRWLSMRTDNYWILDAMTIDHARCRNRVGMDLWNDMAARPYYAASAPKALTGVRGRLVEVFLNGRYQGVYNFCERADRQQLGLIKSKDTKAHGCLYKARDWGTWTLLGVNRGTGNPVGQKPPRYDNGYNGWASWEIKYPEPDNNTQACWEPLYNACELVGYADDKTFCRNVAKHFDLPAVRDYYLFIELLHAVDNTGKNMQWAVFDQSQSPMLTPVPWDLDGTFGRSWDGHKSDCYASNDYRRWLLSGGMQNALFERLRRLNPDDWNAKLARRYRELRRDAFNPDKLYARFSRYFDLLRLSGADRRETKRWNNRDIYLDFDGEAQYLRQWLAERIATLDKQYDY